MPHLTAVKWSSIHLIFKASKTNRGAGLKMLWMLVIIGNITIHRFLL